jgi:glycosyltransferase involved in cell wall biosynthesis
MKFHDNGANLGPLTVLMVTGSIEPSGLGEHMITLAGALPRGVRATLVFPATYAGLNSTRRARDAGLPAFALPLAALRQGSPTFVAALDGVRPDLVHLHAGVPEEGHKLAAAVRSWGARAVIRTEHNPYTLRTLKVTTPKVKALEAAYAAGVRCVDRIICVSRGACLTYRMAQVAVPFSVVHNGIVPRIAKAPRDPVRAGLGLGGEPLILTVGRFVQQKWHITLLDALPRLLVSCPTAMLAWVGQGPFEAALRARAQALGVSAHILFLGKRGDVPDLMGAADLLCMPSYFEGHPLVILEALAAGLPVVAARSLGITEAIRDGETGLLFPFDNAPVLAHTLARLLADPVLMAHLGAAGASWVRGRFTATRMALETLQVYRQALAGNTIGRAPPLMTPAPSAGTSTPAATLRASRHTP